MIFNQMVYSTILSLFHQLVTNDPTRFEAVDVGRVTDPNNQWWIERFALISDTEQDATNALAAALDWRKSFGINHLTDADFADIYATGNALFIVKARSILYYNFLLLNKKEYSLIIGRIKMADVYCM